MSALDLNELVRHESPTLWTRKLARYTHEQLRFADAAYGLGRWTGADSNELHWLDSGPLGGALGLRCHGTAGQFWFGLGEWSQLHPALVVPRDDIPGHVREGLMESVSQPLLLQLQRLVGGPINVLKLESDNEALASDLPLRAGFIWRAVGAAPVSGCFRASVAMLDRTESLSRDLDVQSAPDPGLSVLLPVVASRVALTLAQFRSLRIGDVLRPTPQILVNQPLRVELPLNRRSSARLQARLTQQSLLLESNVKARIEPSAPNGAEGVGDDLNPINLDEVDLDVAIEVGQLNLTVGELGRLKAGQAIPLSRAINPAAVRLTVRNQVVATGELVAVGDEFAVMIKNINGSGSGKSS